MNYTWQIALWAFEQEMPFDDVRFINTRSANPYVEVSFDDINRTELADDPVEVNLLYRYGPIFAELIDVNDPQYPEVKAALIDLLVHYLTLLDLRQGLSRHEFYLKFLRRDIESGLFGKELAETLGSFEKWKRKYVFNSMLKLYVNGPSLLLLKTLLKAIFPKSISYLSSDKEKRLLLYIGEKQTERFTQQMCFITEMFVPVDYTVNLFWLDHFGIIGVGQTMLPEEIMLF